MDLDGPPVTYATHDGFGTGLLFQYAFSHGCGGYIDRSFKLANDWNVALWGELRLRHVFVEGFNQGRTIYYGDHAYFGRKWFYRITKVNKANGPLFPMQYILGTNELRDHDKVRRLAIETNPRNTKSSKKIIICAPPEAWCLYEGISREGWIKDTVCKIRNNSPRNTQIVFREKRSHVTLREHLQDCHALVTHHSNAAVEAVCFGTPVFVTSRCAALPVANTDLTKITEPQFPSDELRSDWIAALCGNQWTMEEIQDGKCWKDLESIKG